MRRKVDGNERRYREKENSVLSYIGPLWCFPNSSSKRLPGRLLVSKMTHHLIICWYLLDSVICGLFKAGVKYCCTCSPVEKLRKMPLHHPFVAVFLPCLFSSAPPSTPPPPCLKRGKSGLYRAPGTILQSYVKRAQYQSSGLGKNIKTHISLPRPNPD